MRLAKLLDKARQTLTAPPADPSASEKKGTERRRSTRAESAYEVRLLDAAKRPADGAVRLMDLSGVGLGITSSKDFAMGQAVGVRFETAGGRPVSATARVRWIRPEGVLTAYGLELEGLGYWDRRRVERLSDASVWDPEDMINAVLQVGAACMAAAAAVDWVVSDPVRQSMAAFAFPFFLTLAVGAMASWLVARQI